MRRLLKAVVLRTTYFGHLSKVTHCLVSSFLTSGCLQKQGTKSIPEKKTFGQIGLGFLQVGSQVGTAPGINCSLGPHSMPPKYMEPSWPIASGSFATFCLRVLAATQSTQQ